MVDGTSNSHSLYSKKIHALTCKLAGMSPSWAAAVVIVITAVSLTAIGCSIDESATPTPATVSTMTLAPSATPTPNSDSTSTPLATPTEIPSQTEVPVHYDPDYSGFLRFAIPEGPPHYDPHLTVSSALSSWGAGLAYSRLLKFDTSTSHTSIICDLCKSWEQTNPLTFRFKIRDDVRWHQISPPLGRSLTAQDIAFSLNRMATEGYANASILSNINEINALGDKELLIRLHAPDSELLEKLADSHSRIVAHETVETHGDLRLGPSVGTGPWIATEVRPDFTQLIANPDYHIGNIPYLDGIEIQVMPSQSVRVAGVRSKVIDIAQANYDLIESAREVFSEINWIGVDNPAAGIEIAINTNRKPMNSRLLRTAMMLTWAPAEDPHGYRPTTDNSNPTPQNQLSSLGLPTIDSIVPIEVQFEFDNRLNDLDKAKTILLEGDLTVAENVLIKVGDYGHHYINQAHLLAEGLASIGINAEIEKISTRIFGDEVWLAGDYDIMVGAPPPVSSTTGYLFAVHHSNGSWNTTGYINSEIDRLIETQAQEYDPTKRARILTEIQHLILDGSHRFISTYRTNHWMFWDYVKDFNPKTPKGDTEFLTRIWLKPIEN